MQIDSVALELISLFEKQGYEAYAVGGCVRDSIMCRPCSDTDITVSCPPDVTMSVLEQGGVRYVETGIKHGTVSAIVNGRPYEITTFRTDGEYTDNRHPDSVEFVSELSLDLSRRDFTVNAMAYSKRTGAIDLFGGKDDIKNKIIRTVGDADARFNEDALRILRALRFASVLGFEIESLTAQSILKNSHLLENVARERITAELEKLLVGQNAVGILTRFQPVFCDILGVDSIDCSAFYHLPPDFALRLASLCDGKTLVLSNAVKSRVKNVRENCNVTIKSDMPSVCTALYKFGFDPLCDILVFTNRTDILSQVKKAKDAGEVYSISQLDVSGRDLASLGLQGADIKTALEKALFAVINKKITNQKQKILDYINTL